jgi:tetratricopeptide (TPR) repeat protein
MSFGDVYQKQGKLDEAIAAYEKSIELKPTFTYSLYCGSTTSCKASM